MKTQKATLTVHAAFTVGEVDPRIYSGFLEHLGRAVYGGIFEPGHPTADAQGLRTDVLQMVQDLDMPLTRYPGGNYVSGFKWEDSVGPVSQRPKRLDWAWKSLEPNTFGLAEFMDWCAKAHSAPMLAVNLGTRGPAEAADLVEYTNHPGGTAWSDLRRGHGYPEPFAIKTWCLGNEMDGPWQTGAKTAGEYGRVAAEAAKMMKWTDRSIELVACGSSGPAMETFGSWEWEVLNQTFHHVEYLSIHRYFNKDPGHTSADFLGFPEDLDRYIQNALALCDAVAANQKSTKRIHLSLDEWNCWYHSKGQERRSPEWTTARPLLEDIYTFEDALVNAGALNVMLGHCDRLKVACLAQTVNVIAPIMTQPGCPAWRQTIYWPQYFYSRHGRGTVLRGHLESPGFESRPGGRKEAIQATTFMATAVHQKEKGEVVVFALNRGLDSALEARVILEGFSPKSVLEAVVLAHDNLAAVNTAENPDEVVPKPFPGVDLGGQHLDLKLPPACWVMIRVKV